MQNPVLCSEQMNHVTVYLHIVKSVFSKLSLLKAISPDFFWHSSSWDSFWLHRLRFFVFPMMLALEFLLVSFVYVVSHYALCKLNVGLWQMLACPFSHLLSFPVWFLLSNSHWDCKRTCEKRTLKRAAKMWKEKEGAEVPFSTFKYNRLGLMQNYILRYLFPYSIPMPTQVKHMTELACSLKHICSWSPDCSSYQPFQSILMTSYNYSVSCISLI